MWNIKPLSTLTPMFGKRTYSGPAVGKWKRYRRATGAKYRKSRPMSRSKPYRQARFKSAVMRVVNRNAETKEVMRELKKNQVVTHNTVTLIDNNAFYSEIGTHGGNNVSQAQRIGNKLFCKGFKVSLMIESQQYRPLVNYWLYLVRRKGGDMDTDLTTSAAMFEGVSTTIPMDYIDTGKVDVLYSKKITIKAPGTGSILAAGASGTFDTAQTEGVIPDLYEGIYSTVTNPQRIMKFYVPINKTIQYRDSNDAATRLLPASYRYQWVMVAYDNYSSPTGSTTWPAGHVSMTSIMKFTDV